MIRNWQGQLLFRLLYPYLASEICVFEKKGSHFINLHQKFALFGSISDMEKLLFLASTISLQQIKYFFWINNFKLIVWIHNWSTYIWIWVLPSVISSHARPNKDGPFLNPHLDNTFSSEFLCTKYVPHHYNLFVPDTWFFMHLKLNWSNLSLSNQLSCSWVNAISGRYFKAFHSTLRSAHFRNDVTSGLSYEAISFRMLTCACLLLPSSKYLVTQQSKQKTIWCWGAPFVFIVFFFFQVLNSFLED